ncbi:hypothetical protein Q5H93_09880 [Hymenobacter sp. ASUV-10]|uniref:PEGA domain-containing protein n=1 Tax=Hymenobacter aranciens TaxID=3063996 RepID=A0ABT9BEU5_9BACT|nr:hypothetical protein [Hymenobacter sp. ASUV-10]MDO7875038.1 hypothetical protein [Hymenobacter sp. ASUV-10]
MKHSLLFLALLSVVGSSGCASIVSKTRWPVAVSSVPVGATLTVTNRKGKEVFSGVTPAAIELRSGSAYFKREIYTLTFATPGYAPKTTTLEAGINGWYFGNFAIGGVIGFLIVDPITGAMYRISQKEVSVALTPTTGFVWPAQPEHGLRIVSLNDVPESLRPSLERLP